MSGTSLRVKYIFLGFARAFFKDSPTVLKWKWDPDISKTNILIADKYAIDTGVAAMRPSIILSRGGYGWSGIYRNEGVPNDNFFIEKNVPFGSAEYKDNKSFTDLMNGTISYNIIGKNGVEVEEISDHLFTALSGYRDKLKSKGVHKIRGLNVGEERLLRQGSEIELQGVTISLQYTMQKTVNLAGTQYNIRVFIDGEEVFEMVDFKVLPDGNSIEFKEAPEEDSNITINFIDAITLEEEIDVVPVEITDGIRRVFTLPAGKSVYGYYKLVEEMLINNEGDPWVTVS